MRYTWQGQEVVCNDNGELVGVNIGFDFCSEHEWGYSGRELAHRRRRGDYSSPSFEQALIDKLDMISLIECDDGLMALTSYPQGRGYDIADRDSYMEGHHDVRTADPDRRPGACFDAFWDENSFLIYAIDGYSSKILCELYDHILNYDVAVSPNFLPIFRERGLSFVIVSHLSKEDHETRNRILNIERIALDAREDLGLWLREHGNSSWEYSTFKGAVWLSNVQVSFVLDVDNTPVPYFYYEPHDMLAWTKTPHDNISSIYFSKMPHWMSAEGVQALYLTGNSDEYTTRAKDLDHQSREELLMSMWREEIGDKVEIADGSLATHKYKRLP